MSGLRDFSTRQTPQYESIPGTDQVPNSANGYVWQVDDWMRLERFLILGTEGGTFYIRERPLVRENAEAVLRCIRTDGPRTVHEIVNVSQSGRAVRNDPAIFALALAATFGDDPTRSRAFDALPDVCRIGTHLYHFCTFVQNFRGWGRGLRRAVNLWYARDINDLAYDMIKYRQRDGWMHRDVIRLGHPKPVSEEHNALLRWAVEKGGVGPFPEAIDAFESAQRASDPDHIVRIIEAHGNRLPREAIPTEFLTPAVWNALLGAGMPMTAMIRNLASMTACGLLTPTSDATTTVVNTITDGGRLARARIHPIAVLAAMLTYRSGHGARGKLTWAPVPRIVDALDEAFYASFENVESTSKRWLLGLDVSSSMDMDNVANIPGLTPRVASSALAMVTAATGDPYEVVAFTTAGRGGYRRDNTLTILPFSPRERLDDVCAATGRLDFGGTDCALPMIYATEESREVDAFVIYTDSETWAGTIHPSQALREYRRHSGIAAKLVVVGMTSNGFTIADPNDAGMLDVVGMDTSTPAAISDYVAGRTMPGME